MSFFERDGYRSTCERCDGEGESLVDCGPIGKSDERMLPCDECEGTGLRLTDVGRELVTFLRDHYGLEVKRD